jgi:PhnB protein
MDTKINIYLSFNGKCREAMTFYKECFGGELTFQTFEGSPMESLSPNGNKQLILQST